MSEVLGSCRAEWKGLGCIVVPTCLRLALLGFKKEGLINQLPFDNKRSHREGSRRGTKLESRKHLSLEALGGWPLLLRENL